MSGKGTGLVNGATHVGPAKIRLYDQPRVKPSPFTGLEARSQEVPVAHYLAWLAWSASYLLGTKPSSLDIYYIREMEPMLNALHRHAYHNEWPEELQNKIGKALALLGENCAILKQYPNERSGQTFFLNAIHLGPMLDTIRRSIMEALDPNGTVFTGEQIIAPIPISPDVVISPIGYAFGESGPWSALWREGILDPKPLRSASREV